METVGNERAGAPSSSEPIEECNQMAALVALVDRIMEKGAELQDRAMNAGERLERMRLTSDLIDERLRAMAIMNGEDPDPPQKSLEELRAEVALLRAENDLVAAEWHVKRRRKVMRLVDGSVDGVR